MSTEKRTVKNALFWIADFSCFLQKTGKTLCCKGKLPVEKDVENVDNDL